ncbi:alpha-galactosidase [Streptomyces armeniacus]|uniref:Alpha-galactosidase n=1 Tax=Streptomyces armeniacus TaxID=83291 RepID=A0A345XTA6_9ACTN|nr:alpha-galactosidase [Streptomyces armeniacus]AXK34872.1 alpha-galactosidase [Streptomyces armeniacus]
MPQSTDAHTALPLQLRAAGVSVVLCAADGGLPSVLYWGADLGPLDGPQLAQLRHAATPSPVSNDLDRAVSPSLALEHAAGWNGRPGLTGHRDGTGWSPLFTLTSLDAADRTEGGGRTEGGRIEATGTDEAAGLGLRIELELLPSGLLRQRAEVTNTAAGERPFALDALALTLPVPPVATELLDLAGRWGRERAPQRTPFAVGMHTRENRRGRTGPEAPLILAAGTPGFGFRSGEVWAVHVAWSGNHQTYAERNSTGAAVLGGGELLLPGEVRLSPGERYQSPWVYATYGTGLDAVAGRFHRHLRAERPRSGPRPVVLNTWEAVYFDQSLERLTELARLGAEAGAERFVLDDGWFRHRRDDTAGLGDWYVDEHVWPDGLAPLITAVHGLGMDFGLWVEPEMVNPDSDLARAHPDWLLATGGRQPLASRHQQVLDLARPEAYAYILERLDALLGEYDIAYLKWDHNRDLLDAGHGPQGTPGVHAQTHAVYRLLDELRALHPRVEIESCSSGGLRVDLGILERTDRVWGSDCIEPLERQQIQRWTTQLLPPELIGSHVGAPCSHTTGRTHDLAFRAGTALFASFGIEWDLTSATPRELAELAHWVELYKEVRGLLHTGEVVRAEPYDPALAVHGVVSADRRDALFALVQLDAPLTSVPDMVRLPGLDPGTRYRVRVQPPSDARAFRQKVPTPWTDGGVVLTGSALAHAGVRAPALNPEQLLLVRVEAVS